jgi:hypothetical protein
MLVLTLGGCGGGGDTPPTPPPTPGTLAISLSSTTGSVTGTGTLNATLTATRGGSFGGAVTLVAEGAPTGVTMTFTPSTLAAGNTTSDLAITVSASTTPGTYPLTVRATGSGVSAVTASYVLTVNAAATPDFTVSVTPGTLTVEQGKQATATVTIGRTGGFAGTVSFAVTGVPVNVQVAIAPNTTTGTTATLTFSADLIAIAGTYPLVIVATENGPRERTVPLTLVVAPAPSAGTLTLSPSTIGVTQGQSSAPITVTLVRGAGVTGDVTFSLENLPPFVTGTFTPNPSNTGVSTLTIHVGINHGPGVVTLQVRASIGANTIIAPLQLSTGRFDPPDFALAVAPTATSLTAGSGTTAAISLARLANYTGAVSFAVTGTPAGVTASVTPSPTTGNTATLTLASTAGATPGVYPVVITGTGAGITGSRSATLTLTVNAPGGGGNIQWRFCAEPRVPKWFGVRSGTSGPWTVVTPGANNTYAFAFPSNGQVAYVQETTLLNFGVTVLYLTPQEALEAAARECAASVPTKTINGTVTGVAVPRSALIVMGGSSFALVDAPQTAFTLTNVPDRPTDLIAFRGFGTLGDFGSYERVIVRRNLNPANGSTLPLLDFEGTEWTPSVSRNSFWDGFGTDPFSVSVSLITANGLAGLYVLHAPSLTPTRSVRGLPATSREATDLYQVLGSTTNPTAPRQLVTYARDLVPTGTRTFGPLLTTPPVSLVGTNPLRLRVQAPWQTEYNAQAGAFFAQQNGIISTSITLSGSANFFGGSSYTLEIPDFTGAAGWLPGWMVQAGRLTQVQTTGIGVVSGGTDVTPRDGLELRIGQRRGTITP